MNADTGEFVPNEVFMAKLRSFLTTKNPIISSPVDFLCYSQESWLALLVFCCKLHFMCKALLTNKQFN